jgi:Icc-related predicted phosphoesterase
MYLKERVREIQPKVHLFGHIHESRGTLYEEQCWFVNASSCDRQGKLIHPPFIIDMDLRFNELRISQ